MKCFSNTHMKKHGMTISEYLQLYPSKEYSKRMSQMCNKRKSSWNKGLTKETDSRVMKYSKRYLGIGITQDKSYMKTLLYRIKVHNAKDKGGSINVHGYKVLGYLGKEMTEHVYVWRKNNNWLKIPKGFVIHHRNMNKLDNKIENLMLLPRDIHTVAHTLRRWGAI